MKLFNIVERDLFLMVVDVASECRHTEIKGYYRVNVRIQSTSYSLWSLAQHLQDRIRRAMELRAVESYIFCKDVDGLTDKIKSFGFMLIGGNFVRTLYNVTDLFTLISRLDEQIKRNKITILK